MVLLRNEVVRAANGEAAPLLPLTVGAGQRVAVIGPLAARGTIMGGGSSQVRPHPVSHPLAALSERLGAAGAEVVYEAGCSIDRYVPEFQPAGGLAAEVALPAKAGEEGVWTSVGAVPRLAVGLSGDGSEVSPRARWRWRGSYTASASGEHTIGLIAAGWGRVWLDGALVLDTTENPTRGGTYYGWGTDELRACYALEAGRTYEVAAEFHPVRSIPFVAMRVGIGPPHDAGALDRAAGLARSADVAVVIVGLTNEWETEGSDRVGFELPAPQAQLIEAVGAACPRTVVVLNIGSPVALDVAAQQPAVLVSWYPGMEFGNALADVLTGAVNPSGRLPTTFPQRLEDCPAYLNYPGEAGRVRYGEGVFIGYRGYDARDVEPAYPFGHGLSYTTFGYADLVVAPSDAGHVVQVTVTNTGTCRGAEVVQCYLAPPPSPVARPPKELVAFAKVDLEPGEQRRVTLELPERVRRYWDATADDWAVAPGEHQVLVGPSSRKLLLRASLVPAG
jgi:beta-glucosidase